MSDDIIPEALVTFVRAISEDDTLSEWLFSLKHLRPAARSAALKLTAAQMSEAGEDEEVIRAVTLMEHSAFYDAAHATLAEMRGV